MSSKQKMQYLVVSALGEDRAGIVNDLTAQLTEHGCNIVDSRMTVLGGAFAVLMMLEGNWNNIAKVEQLLPEMQEQLGLTMISQRSSGREQEIQGLPYTVEVFALDHPGIVHQLAGFFSGRGINIQDLHTDSQPAAHTGSPVFSATLTVHIPETVHIARLREEFLDFCDGLNLDAVLEPAKR